MEYEMIDQDIKDNEYHDLKFVCYMKQPSTNPSGFYYVAYFTSVKSTDYGKDILFNRDSLEHRRNRLKAAGHDYVLSEITLQNWPT
jgi:hypothetical protein